MAALQEATKFTHPHGILVADDDLEFLEDFVSEAKRVNGFDIIFSYSSHGIIDNWISLDEEAKRNVSVIVLDLHMEDDFSGFRALKFFRSVENLKHIPIIIFSHSGQLEDIRQSYVMGATSYIQKPSDIKDLRKLINLTINYWGKQNKFELTEPSSDGSEALRGEVKRDRDRKFEMATFPNVKTYRIMANLKRPKLSKLTGVGQDEISRLEAGHAISVGKVLKIARALSARIPNSPDLSSGIVKKRRQ